MTIEIKRQKETMRQGLEQAGEIREGAFGFLPYLRLLLVESRIY